MSGNFQNPTQKADSLLRLRQVLEIIPVSKATWWNGVYSGRYPQPIMLGPKTACWKESEIRQLADEGVQHG